MRRLATENRRRCDRLLQGALRLLPASFADDRPGTDYPAGGYPPATALVVVHGQHRLSERPETFWRWITAHEISHMYWGDHVLAQGPDSLNWLMIGMGIRADQEYRRARNITGAGNLEANFGSGILQGRDTTIDVTREQESLIDWNFNNIVEHGKSIAMLNALESVVGRQVFDTVYRRILCDYAGNRLGWRDLQRAAETESGLDLDWFFESWVRSSANVSYKIASKECKDGDCIVKVERTGAMNMPVTVAARFEDGSEQRPHRAPALHRRAPFPLDLAAQRGSPQPGPRPHPRGWSAPHPATGYENPTPAIRRRSIKAARPVPRSSPAEARRCECPLPSCTAPI